MIQRIEITNMSSLWDSEVEASTEQLLLDYEISREQIISIVHDNGRVFLYWII